MTFGYSRGMAGRGGIYRSITANGETTSSAACARLGFYLLLIGTAMWTIGSSSNVSFPAAIVNPPAAPAEGKEAANNIVAALSPVGFGRGLFPLEVIVNWLAFSLLGTGMLQSAVYSRWLGWIGLVLGTSGILLGITQTFTGSESSLVLFGVLLYLTTTRWLLPGICVTRKAS